MSGKGARKVRTEDWDQQTSGQKEHWPHSIMDEEKKAPQMIRLRTWGEEKKGK